MPIPSTQTNRAIPSSGDTKKRRRIHECQNIFTCPNTWSPGFLQTLFLDDEASTNEEAGRQGQHQSLDVVRGHALVRVHIAAILHHRSHETTPPPKTLRNNPARSLQPRRTVRSGPCYQHRATPIRPKEKQKKKNVRKAHTICRGRQPGGRASNRDRVPGRAEVGRRGGRRKMGEDKIWCDGEAERESEGELNSNQGRVTGAREMSASLQNLGRSEISLAAEWNIQY